MANVLIEESTMSAIGDAIRSKTGKEGLILPSDMPSEIEGIKTGGGNSLDALISRSTSEIYNDTVEVIGNYAFKGCEALTAVDFPKTSTIGRYSFEECKALLSANFPSAISVDRYAFSNCTAMVNANFPALTTIGDHSFYYCEALTSVDFPVATTADIYAFTDCHTLKSVNFPVLKTIGNYAFRNCRELLVAKFPLVESVGNYAFYDDKLLTKLDFPVAKSIGSTAFQYCSVLDTLVLRNTENMCTMSNKNSLSSTPIAKGTGYIYVPSALIESYKANSVWSNYATQFRALEDYTVDGTVTGEIDTTKT